MKKTLELCAAAFAAAMMASCASAPPQPDVPVTSEATLVESYSPAEVTVRATGVGYGEENKAGAEADLKRTAVQFVLLMGTDPIITTPEERMRFQNIEKSFYADVNRFITWEADKVESQKRGSFNGIPVLKRTKAVRVHKENLRRELTERGVLVARETLAAAQGNPVIMVIPDSPQGQTPLMVLDKNGLAKQAAATIESYLTARSYEVIVPRAAEQIEQMTRVQADLGNAGDDPAYAMAMSVGSDVYFVFSGEVQGSKASVAVKAYETTTGRLLGTETGYSKDRPGAAQGALVDEAVSDAVDHVLERVKSYWQADMKQGLQYRLVIRVEGNFDADAIENVQMKLGDLIESSFEKSKENVLTAKTMDYNVWASRDEYSRSAKIYQMLKEKMAPVAKLRQININRKLLVLGLDNP